MFFTVFFNLPGNIKELSGSYVKDIASYLVQSFSRCFDLGFIGSPLSLFKVIILLQRSIFLGILSLNYCWEEIGAPSSSTPFITFHISPTDEVEKHECFRVIMYRSYTV